MSTIRNAQVDLENEFTNRSKAAAIAQAQLAVAQAKLKVLELGGSVPGEIAIPGGPSIPAAPTQPVAPKGNAVFKDSISKAGEQPAAPASAPAKAAEPQAPTKRINIIEKEYLILSTEADVELKRDQIQFDKMMKLIYKVVALANRKAVQSDQEYISEMNIKLQAQSFRIRDTYNTWTHVTITVVSTVVSVGGAVCGLSPLFPKLVAPGIAAELAKQSQAIGTAGQGLQALGSLASNRTEGTRTVLQYTLKTDESKLDDRKGAKQKHNDLIRRAAEDYKALANMLFETSRAMNGG